MHKQFYIGAFIISFIVGILFVALKFTPSSLLTSMYVGWMAFLFIGHIVVWCMDNLPDTGDSRF